MIRHAEERVATGVGESLSRFAADVRIGLGRAGQKTLPSKYLYDDVGSALFEAISRLPEYGLTAADERILRSGAGEIVGRVAGPLIVSELGSGSGRKTRWLLEALARRQPVTRYFPIDISAAALRQCERELDRLPSLRFEGIESDYLGGLRHVARRREPGQRVLLLFLGSTIGNFDRPVAEAFLHQVRQCLKSGDGLLLGSDLEKPVPRLIAAYDDAAGVTAAFNRNLLVRVNRELDADFDLRAFEHVVRYDADERRIEMHLRARSAQEVSVPAADLRVRFAAGETIWTESSHKFAPREAEVLGGRAGFGGVGGQWVDQKWPFAETLLIAT